MARRRLSKEEREQLQKSLVKNYIRTKEWLEKNCPALKRSIDKFNHRLFHFMQDHHVNLKFFRDEGFTDWRAQSAYLFIPCIGLALLNIFFFVRFSGQVIFGNALFSVLSFLFYMAAVQTIESSRYSHEGEIALSEITDSTPALNTVVKTSTESEKPQKRKPSLSGRLFGLVSVACFGYIAYIYCTDPEKLRDLCINNYTYSLLPTTAIEALEAFFKLEPTTGFWTLFFVWVIADALIRIPFRILAWLASKMSPDKHTRDI